MTPVGLPRYSLAAAFAAALLTAALTATAIRPWGLGWLAWFAYLPLFAALHSTASPLPGAMLGAVAALGVTSVAYEAAAGIGAIYYPLATLLATVPFALAGAGTSLLRRRLPHTLVWLIAPLLWVVAELIPAQPALLGRFALPLSMIGYSQAELPALHLARFSSVTATSTAVLIANALFLELLRSVRALKRSSWFGAASLQITRPAAHSESQHTLNPGPFSVRKSGSRRGPSRAHLGVWASTAGLALLVVTVWAAWVTRPVPLGVHEIQLGSLPPPGGALERASVRVGIVQPHLPTALLAASRVLPEARNDQLRHLTELSAKLNSSDSTTADLAIWPEAAWPGRLSQDNREIASGGAKNNVHDNNAIDYGGTNILAEADRLLSAHPPLLFGAASQTTGGLPGNSAFSWAEGQLSHVYDKVHLVPIGEDGLAPGDGFRLAKLGGLQVAPLICYDVVFPSLARAAARGGAELLAVLTDDAFAAFSSVPRQHLRVAAFRAVETGLPVAFAANTGPSAIFDRNGSVLASAAAGEAATLAATLGLATGSTPYLRYGNWVGVTAGLLVAALVALGASRVVRPTGGARG